MLKIHVNCHIIYHSKGHIKSCCFTVIVIVNVILLGEDYHSNFNTDLMVLDYVRNRTRLGRVQLEEEFFFFNGSRRGVF